METYFIIFLTLELPQVFFDVIGLLAFTAVLYRISPVNS